MKKLSLSEVLEGLDDPRRERSVQYPLYEVLFMMLTAVICGATSYVKIELFAKSRESWLKKYLKLENGIPDACTFRNVIKGIDAEQLHTVFVTWMKSAVETVTGVVAIDGKQARRTKDTNGKALHVVSAFSSECKLVLGQLVCEEKSNEITAIPRLLEVLAIKGCIVTIDAMGTQTEIARKITEKGADYILALKGNQQTFYKDVQLFFADYRNDTSVKKTSLYARKRSQGHGRIETRECFLCEDIAWLTCRENWSRLNGIGLIHSKTDKNGTITEQDHYFIYSCRGLTAKEIMGAKRAHWGIENSLHWVLDMQFREDESRARKDNSAENLNVIRHMAYNVLKRDSLVKGSFSDKQFKCLLDDSYLDHMVTAFINS